MFTIRRLLLALILIYFNKHTVLQIQANQFLTLMLILYIGKYKPWLSSFTNNLELFNEFCGLLIQYHQISFTDFVPDVEFKTYNLSMVFIMLTYLTIIVNCLVVGKEFAR